MAGKGKVPAIMLYTGDWIKDPELSMCSPATRGIWIDWLCRLQDMCSSGREPVLRGSISGLARAGRCTDTEAISALKELGETGTAFVTMSHDVTVSHSEITVPIEVSNRRLSREHRARVGAALRQRKSRENRKNMALLEAGDENVTTPLSSSSSFAVAEEEEKTPPTPRGGERGRVEKGRNPRRRKIPDVTIPPELLAIGIDQDAFEQRVLGRERTKPLSAWQSELDDLVPMVEECGGVAVLEAFKDATSGAWTSCLPKHVRAAAAGTDAGAKGHPEDGRIPVLPIAHDVDCMGCRTCGEVVDTPGLVMSTNCMSCDLAHYGPHNDPTDASPLYAGYVYELGPDGRPNEWSTP